MIETFDYIVVGAGTAGCVMVRRLLERTDGRVLLLESGPAYPRWALDPPLASLRLGRHWAWPLQSVPQPKLAQRRIRFPMGRVLGGSSSVNAMMCVPGSPLDYDEWAALGAAGWSAGETVPFLSRAIADDGGAPLKPTRPLHRAEFTEAFLAACGEGGLRRVDGLTGADRDAAGYFSVFQRDGQRVGAAKAYLEPVRRHARLTMGTGLRVRRVLLEGTRAGGVEYVRGRTTITARAIRGVVLCAGVFMTPQLLQCSGVGRAADLEACGIRVVHDLPGVGAGLQDHVSVPLLYRTARPSPGRRSRWLQAALRHAWKQDGVMASNCCEAGCFLAGDDGDPRAGIEVVTHFQSRHRAGAVELECLLLRPQSRGEVRLNPENPWGMPLIDPRYFAAEKDLDTLLAGLERARDIVAQPALGDYFRAGELLPGTAVRSRRELREFVAAHAGTAYHPAGTCRMGVDAQAVVDPKLRIRGLERLWVADASIIPTVPTGHTAATVLTIAERAADFIAQETT